MDKMTNETIKKALSQLLDEKIVYAMELEVDYRKFLDDFPESDLPLVENEKKFDEIANKIQATRNQIGSLDELIDELN